MKNKLTDNFGVNSPISTIVFDFDGTLVNTLDFLIEIAGSLSVEFGLEKITEEKIAVLRNKGLREFIKEYKIPLFKIPSMAKRLNQEINKRVDRLEMFEGLESVLVHLSHNYKLGILTSNNKNNVLKFLSNNDIEFFDFIYSGISSFGKDKVLKKMLRERSLKKEEVIYIGDEIRDIVAAKKVGIASVAVTWGINTKEAFSTEKHKPSFVVNNPKELGSLFD